MKRFYCTKCKKVKRVQSWPTLIENQDSFDPADRIGQCNYHSEKKQYHTRSISEDFAELNLTQPAKFPSLQEFQRKYAGKEVR